MTKKTTKKATKKASKKVAKKTVAKKTSKKASKKASKKVSKRTSKKAVNPIDSLAAEKIQEVLAKIAGRGKAPDTLQGCLEALAKDGCTVEGLESIDAVLKCNGSSIPTNMNAWNWQFKPSPPNIAGDVIIGIRDLFRYLPEGQLGVHENFKRYVSTPLYEVLMYWKNSVYEARMTEYMQNKAPFEFWELAEVLNRFAKVAVDEIDPYDEDPVEGTNLPVFLFGRGSKKFAAKFVMAELKRTFFGVFVNCRIQRYRWVKGALRTVQTTFAVDAFSGKKLLKDTGVGTTFAQDDLTDSIALGKKVIQLNLEPSYAMCNGPMEIKHMWGWRDVAAQGRVMIDQEGMTLIDPDLGNAVVVYGENVNEDDDGIDLGKMSEADYALVDHTVYGFSLVTKLWGKFSVTDITDIQFRSDAFDKLVIDNDDKQLILSLTKHTDPELVSDFVDQKGGGCTFLFHGPPGLGKTLTAEAVAEVLKRPLYVAGVGELGTDVNLLEKNLNRTLQLASRWNAVLLLDEADIFLEERARGDVERNAMVGTFLRLLEYYNGILILTSNRVKNIDPAFYSRISFAKKYADHTDDTRFKIIQNLLEINKIQLTVGEVQKLASYDVNGRQLKNSIRLAKILALSEKRAVALQDIDRLVQKVLAFPRELAAASH